MLIDIQAQYQATLNEIWQLLTRILCLILFFKCSFSWGETVGDLHTKFLVNYAELQELGMRVGSIKQEKSSSHMGLWQDLSGKMLQLVKAKVAIIKIVDSKCNNGQEFCAEKNSQRGIFYPESNNSP